MKSSFNEVVAYLRDEATPEELNRLDAVIQVVVLPWDPPLDDRNSLFSLRDRHGNVVAEIREMGDGRWEWFVEWDRGGLAPEQRHGITDTLPVAATTVESVLHHVHYHVRRSSEYSPPQITRTELLRDA